jgi:hypothetical protein
MLASRITKQDLQPRQEVVKRKYAVLTATHKDKGEIECLACAQGWVGWKGGIKHVPSKGCLYVLEALELAPFQGDCALKLVVLNVQITVQKRKICPQSHHYTDIIVLLRVAWYIPGNNNWYLP